MLTKIKRLDIFLGLFLLGGYLVSRLINLGIIPIFTDEAIYLRWSQIMAHDAALRYLPLIDGKPPLFMWLTSVVMRLMPTLDPLLTGRLVSVGAGLGGLVGIFFTSYVLFRNKKISYLSALLYLICPFTFFYDRFGLVDSLLAMWGIWSLGLGVLLVQTLRLDVAMILGMVIGFGLLTKSPALFFLFLMPLALIVGKWHWKLAPLFVVVLVLAQGFFSILRLFPLFNMINQKNHEFILTLAQFFQNPLQNFWGNFKTLATWEIGYLTIPIVLLIILAFKKYFRLSIMIGSLFVIHIVYMSVFNKVIYPRFLLTFTPYLLILAAVGLSNIKNMTLIILIILIQPLYTNFKLITDPVNAPLLQADRDQYIDGWAAGYGVKEVRVFLADKTGVIATEGTFGLMPYSLELYQKDYPNVEIKPYWPLPATSPAGTNYLLVYQHIAPPIGWKTEEIMRFRQGNSQDFLQLYKVL